MSKTEESMQEAGSNSEEFGEGDQECFSHCPQSSSWRGRMKQTEKVSNHHLSLAACHIVFAYL